MGVVLQMVQERKEVREKEKEKEQEKEKEKGESATETPSLLAPSIQREKGAMGRGASTRWTTRRERAAAGWAGSAG